MRTNELADAVLPLIRTRADLHRWGAANEHGRKMHQGVDILQAAIPTTNPALAHAVTHKALASAITVIARADDSSGIIGDACRWSVSAVRCADHLCRPSRTFRV